MVDTQQDVAWMRGEIKRLRAENAQLTQDFAAVYRMYQNERRVSDALRELGDELTAQCSTLSKRIIELTTPRIEEPSTSSGEITP